MTNNEPAPQYTFHNHEVVGAEMADVILRRLGCLGKREREEVVALVADHQVDFVNTRRKKLAKVLRASHASRLLKLREADVHGREPLRLDLLERDLARVREFYAEDKLLADLGIDARLLMQLDRQKRFDAQDPDYREPMEGRVIGEKLKLMQNILNARPRSTKAELLKHAGYKEAE